MLFGLSLSNRRHFPIALSKLKRERVRESEREKKEREEGRERESEGGWKGERIGKKSKW